MSSAAGRVYEVALALVCSGRSRPVSSRQCWCLFCPGGPSWGRSQTFSCRRGSPPWWRGLEVQALSFGTQRPGFEPQRHHLLALRGLALTSGSLAPSGKAFLPERGWWCQRQAPGMRELGQGQRCGHPVPWADPAPRVPPIPAWRLLLCRKEPGVAAGAGELPSVPLVLWARADGTCAQGRPFRRRKEWPTVPISGMGRDWSPNISPASSLLCCHLGLWGLKPFSQSEMGVVGPGSDPGVR